MKWMALNSTVFITIVLLMGQEYTLICMFAYVGGYFCGYWEGHSKGRFHRDETQV